jgi:hypothetical protein
VLRRWNDFELGRLRDAPAALDYVELAQEIETAADYIEMMQKTAGQRAIRTISRARRAIAGARPMQVGTIVRRLLDCRTLGVCNDRGVLFHK